MPVLNSLMRLLTVIHGSEGHRRICAYHIKSLDQAYGDGTAGAVVWSDKDSGEVSGEFPGEFLEVTQE